MLSKKAKQEKLNALFNPNNLEARAKARGMSVSKYKRYRARLNLQKFLESTPLNLIIAGLILLSVILIFWEFLLPPGPKQNEIIILNDYLTWFFIVELTVRYFVAPNKRIYFSNYWIDIIAVFPAFRVFRTLRILRLLRVLRLARASILLLKESGWLSSRLEKYFGNFGFLALTTVLLIFCATIATISFEHPPLTETVPIETLVNTLWETTFLFISGEVTGGMPTTSGGKTISILTTLAGLVVFAIMVGTISATMTAFFKTTMDAKDLTIADLEDHIIICGFDGKVEVILQELEAVDEVWRKGVVLVAETDIEINKLHGIKNTKRLFHINEDFTQIEVLEMAGAKKAKTAMVLADKGNNLGDQDRDARTVLAALTMEKLNPVIYTCAELLNESNATHLRLAGVEEIISRNSLAAGLFSTSAVNQGISVFVSDILSHQDGNYVRKFDVPKEFQGKTFLEASTYFKKELDSLVIGIERVVEGKAESHINPAHDLELKDQDKLTVILKKDSEICTL